jgi:hypothetical protein
MGYNEEKLPGSSPPKQKPKIVSVNDAIIILTQCSKLRSIQGTLPTLIQIANFYRQMHLIWDRLSDKEKKPFKHFYYMICRPVISCVKQCCNNDLREFHRRWVGKKRRICYRRFINRCPGTNNLGMGCGCPAAFALTSLPYNTKSIQ